jgi:hypothetical protein
MGKLRFEKTDEKVTRAMAAQNALLFLPESPGQATYVQERLFVMGFIWVNDVTKVQAIEACVANGIVLKNQRIYTLSPDDDAEGYKLCALHQLAADYVAPVAAGSVPPRDRLIEMFTEVSARLSAIEDRLSKIETQLGQNSAAIEKSALRQPVRRP